MGNNDSERGRKVISASKLIILIVCIFGIPSLVYFTYPEIFEQLKSIETVNALLQKYQTAGIIVYLGLSIAQVVIAVIPGQVLYFAAGYAFSFPLGILLATAGCAAGTAISFWLSRSLGRDAMDLLFGKRKINKYADMLTTKKGYLALLILYLIPGFPKDLLAYVAGVTKVDFRLLMVISIIGRLPASAGTVMMGSMLRQDSYAGMALLGVLGAAICIAAFLKRHQLVEYSDEIFTAFTMKKTLQK